MTPKILENPNLSQKKVEKSPTVRTPKKFENIPSLKNLKNEKLLLNPKLFFFFFFLKKKKKSKNLSLYLIT
jgi:hypothetical protein